MPLIQQAVHAWQALGPRTRLFVPILLLILPISATKYSLLLSAEAAALEARMAQTLPHIQNDLVPVLLRGLAHDNGNDNGNRRQLQMLLDTEAQAHPELARIAWRQGGVELQAHNTRPAQAEYPAWFAALVPLQPAATQRVLELPSADAAQPAGQLQLTLSPVAGLNAVWQVTLDQLLASGLTIFAVYSLLALLLHANSRILQRLTSAAQRFQGGAHSTRMAIRGSPEERAMAQVFNGMASAVQNLVGTLQQTQAALRAEKERADVTLASIGDAVITTDLAGQVQTSNAMAQQLTGWSLEQAQGRPLDEVFELQDEGGWFIPQEAPNILGAPDTTIPLWQTPSTVHANHRVLLHPSGQRYAIEYTAAPIRQPDGSTVGCVLVFRDITEKRQLIHEISWQIGHDVLTGLHNRAALEDPFNLALLQARHQHKLLAVCLLDLDHFQPLNLRYGSLGGDHLLQQVATRLASFAGDDHGLARLGGDEFVLLLKGQHSLAEIEQQVHLVQALLSAPYQVEQHSIHLTASIGIAIYPRDTDTGQPPTETNLDTLLRHADQAMYQAKQTGRNRYHLFDAQHDLQVQTHHDQRNRVAQALRDGELRLYYQPKVNMRSGQIIGMEALLRWQHPEQGLVGPFQFLPLVENTDLIIEIGEWVLQEALQQMQHWRSLGHGWAVSVNIAARHFQRPDFVTRLAELLARFPALPPDRLELEILESAALEDVQHMRNVMASSQQLGVQFALDDFGTGYSSLAYLKRLPANTLKIDQAFVRDMLEDPDDLTLVDAIVGMAKSFQRQVIAEGVETIAHGVLLLQLGCDLAQGYGIARPMPADAVAAWAAQFKPAEAWQVWGAVAWVQDDFPLLLAEHDHQTWVAHIRRHPADATARYPHRFGSWYAQRGQKLYGHLPAFTAVGTAIVALHDHNLELARQHNNAMDYLPAAGEPPHDTAREALGLQRLHDLHAALSTQLAALLYQATQKQAQRKATQNFMVYS